MSIDIGTSATATMHVKESHLATVWNLEARDGFPPVFATSHMIGLMEVAGARVLHPLLKEGELSVGVSIDVSHSAPTPINGTVTTEATFTGMDGKLYLFTVTARDEGGEIGRGTHKRAIISEERLLSGAAKRTAKPA